MSEQNIKTCINKNLSVNFGINIVTHCTFLLAIIGAVFFFFTSDIMKNALNSQIQNLLVNSIDKYYYNLTPEQQTTLRTQLSYAQLDTLDNLTNIPTQTQIINNEWIKKIILITIILLVLVLVGCYAVSKSLCGTTSMTEIITENIIIFILVGVVEFLFFTKIIIKYIPDYPSSLMSIFVNQLKDVTSTSTSTTTTNTVQK
jgi:hypothetical protein